MGSSKLRRVGILGGSFDPPHLGHIICSRIVAESLSLDQIIIMPVATQPKCLAGATASKESRYRMVEAISEFDPVFTPSRLEIDRSEISYTVDTIEQLVRIYPRENCQLYWIIGMDSAIHLDSWRELHKIIASAQFAVMRRPGFSSSDIPSRWNDYLTVIDTPLIDISSTSIRQRIADELPIRTWVGEEVEEIIINESLYKG